MNEDRIIAVGDIHGDEDWLSYVAREARKLGISTLVQAGDFGVYPGKRHEKYLKVVEEKLAFYKVRCVFIDGNHDWHEWLWNLPVNNEGLAQISEHLYYAPRGAVWSWDGISLGALGGAHSIDFEVLTEGIDWWRTERITGSQVDLLTSKGKLDILFTHDAPLLSKVPNLTKLGEPNDSINLEQRLLLDEAVKGVTPKLLFHGHYHRHYTNTISYTDSEGDGVETRITGLASNLEKRARPKDSWEVVDLSLLR